MTSQLETLLKNIFSNRFSVKFHFIKTLFYTPNDLTLHAIKIQKLYINYNNVGAKYASYIFAEALSQ